VQSLNAGAQNYLQSEAPGFVDPRFDPSARPSDGGTGAGRRTGNETGGMSANSFDARSAQQRFEADYKQQPSGVADKLNSFSKRLQYAADRRKPHWVSDGHVGHAPGLRMGLDS
jgi:type IV secretion system protein TrbL